MPFSGSTFSHLFDWEKDPQRQEKIINARLEAEFDGIDTGLSSRAAGAASSTDNEVPRFDGSEGKTLQTSGTLIDDSKNFCPITNDVGALGTTTLKWADLHLADGGVINWSNSSGRIIHSSAAGARRLDIRGDTSESQIALGLVGDHTFSGVATGYGILSQRGSTFNSGSTGAVFYQNYFQNLVNVQSSVSPGAVGVFQCQIGTKGASPTGSIVEQYGFRVLQPTAQHTGTASLGVTTNYGLKINNQGAYDTATGITITTAIGIDIDAQSGATTNYGIRNNASHYQLGNFSRGAPVTKTGNFTLADGENNVIINNGASTTVTLPAASTFPGREVLFKTIQPQTLVSASSNVCPNTSNTPGTAILPATDGHWAKLVSDGTNWIIMASSTIA